jgi:hypothetical protein
MPATEAREGQETTKGPVAPKCNDTTAPGHWMCVTHGEEFPHNMAMHSHSDEGSHDIAWVCGAHGPEVP